MNAHLNRIQALTRDALKQINREDQRQKLGQHIIDAQEEERKTIARELHDGPAQSVANLIFHLQLFEQLEIEKREGASKELQRVKELGNEALEMLRGFIREMRPMVLDDLGLVPAITRHAERFRKETGIEIELRLQDPPVLPRAVEINLFRIFQESLRNIRKHSSACKVVIELKRVNQMLFFSIIDNGCGFSLDSDFSGHYGLIGIRERMELMNGSIRINTAPGAGCEIICCFTGD
ncbi:MAG: sensor histidine kinase [Candidatus Wallbacteria bacterium]|nr:sensor histidine kinase [Candidatus Wallbacteria bacterium]